ncbi:bifunctional 4-hydroxy-2-oxoglutarate aldolase/2-dehydro-3-deoxy-phosphogluconate aldolase [Microbacterium sp.]|uniref:bifunctional 4-hydroxy-2-oxoglutarate aldolase/2-dehydro-3-deoxy-phosphogluconate aldolase n=1 Tax=Microbacterium sp. TaxID=51671 RepID=UPI00261657EB|nr:bifunctional 4-hydroxy-2-oxoglutarate aldolase/2-dehydro-3-deoxy-phosphogluconate aldolase [Microbacterium sp.]
MSVLEHPIIPVIEIEDAEHAVPLADALTAGGIGCAEITLRTDAGLAAIRAIATHRPDFEVGAGTVIESAQVAEVTEAGARFVVSPGLDLDVVDASRAAGVVAIPGVATATEIQRAARQGLTHLKLFPAGVLGGPALLKALGGPFPGIRFLPSGGVNAQTIAEYAALTNVFAVSGSWMASRSLIAAGDTGVITRLSAAAVGAYRSASERA